MESSLSFGQWVQERRKTLGFTQVELAKRIDYSLAMIKQVEQDRRKPSLELIHLLVEHLEIPTKEREYFIAVARGISTRSEQSLPQDTRELTGRRKKSTAALAGSHFVTKERELQQLQSHFDRAVAGQSQIVFVTGEAGSGKSTLLAEFAQRVHRYQRRLIVAGGNCNAFSGTGDPYLPFRDAMVMLLGEMDGQWATRLAGMQPGLYKIILPQIASALINYGPDVVDVLAPSYLLLQRANAAQRATVDQWPEKMRQLIKQQRERATQPAPTQLFEQIRLVLETLAKQQPLLLLLDDLQWADTASLNLLFHLTQRLIDSPILIIGAFRSSEVHGRHGNTESEAQQHPLLLIQNERQRRLGEIEVNLDHVPLEEGRSFVNTILDAEPNQLDDDFREELFNRTRGFPLFTAELLRTLQERGHLIHDTAGRWIATPSLDWDTLPTRVEAVIEQRVSRLPSSCQEALKIASVIGEDFAAEVVASVAQERPQNIINQFSNLLVSRHRLLTSIGTQRIRTQRLSQYRFQHILFQAYLYETIDENERSYLHEAVGKTIEIMYAEEPEFLAVRAVSLARHFQKARLPAKAVPYLLLAGNRAMQFSAHENAIAHFEQGLMLLAEMSQSVESERQELELLIGLGTALIVARGTGIDYLHETFRRVLALAERSNDQENQALALFNIWRFYSDRGDFSNCDQTTNQLRRLAAQSNIPAVHLLADHALWTMSLYTGDFVHTLYHTEQGIAWYQPEEHHTLAATHAGHDPGMCCRIFSAYALWYLGYPDQARQRCEDAINLARTIAHPFSLAMALTMAGEIQLLCRVPEAALIYLEEALTLSTTHGFKSWLELGAICQGWAWAQAGRADEGIDRMLYGLDANRQMIGDDSGLHCIAQLAYAYGELGRPEEGLKLLAKALDTSDMSKLRHWTQWQSEFYRLYGELSLLKYEFKPLDVEKIEEIEGAFQRAIKIAQKQQAKSPELHATISLSRFWLYQEKRVEAYQILSKIYQWFNEGFDTPDLQEAKLLLEQLRQS